MNLQTEMNTGHFSGKNEAKMKTSQSNFADRWREKFRRRRRRHDPMLVLNMSAFNFDDGWNRIFNQVKVHENGT